MIYTIVKETTTFETYSVASDSPKNAVKLLELDPKYISCRIRHYRAIVCCC